MKKFMNFKVLFAATLFMLLCSFSVSVFAYSSAFAGGIPPSTDDDNTFISDPSETFIENAKAYAVIETNKEDISVTYVYDNEKNVNENFSDKNVEIYPFENRDWRDDLFRAFISTQYTVDASFVNYYPSDGYRLFAHASDINGLQYLKTANMQNTEWMFAFSSVESLNLSNFDTSNVTDMSRMFFECESLQTLDLSKFDTSNVNNMPWMFCYCESLKTLDLSNFNTSKVNDMSVMFMDCKSLNALDLSKFDTGNVTDMFRMFCGCESLKTLDLSNFNTSNVKIASMWEMFWHCGSIENLKIMQGFFNNIDTNDLCEHSLPNNDSISSYAYQLCEGSSAEKFIVDALNEYVNSQLNNEWQVSLKFYKWK